jgi:hypothetical protein
MCIESIRIEKEPIYKQASTNIAATIPIAGFPIQREFARSGNASVRAIGTGMLQTDPAKREHKDGVPSSNPEKRNVGGIQQNADSIRDSLD